MWACWLCIIDNCSMILEGVVLQHAISTASGAPPEDTTAAALETVAYAQMLVLCQ